MADLHLSRRAALTGAVAVLQAAALPAVVQASPDAELVQLCARWQAAEYEYAAVTEPYTRLVHFEYPAEVEARLEDLHDEVSEAFALLASTPATTDAGRQAKARVALLVMHDRGEGPEAHEGAYVAEQLCRDALAGDAWLARLDVETAERADRSARLMAEQQERRAAQEAAQAAEPPAQVGTPESREASARHIARIAIDHWRERRGELRAARALLAAGGTASSEAAP